MRLSGDFMVICDDRILEYLAENETGTPKEMADSGLVRFSRSYITQRAKILLNYGLVRHLGNGVYTLSERGQQYLDGDLDAAELEPDED
ncbi:MarR family transcriptional regulator [Natrinema longum]|uniref:MarR family transcriptional regulator n=1 Tax=Natrinema longum TaxID=370324 RepID=A0A8A2UEF6_9EURY|nr:MarR family transcriptional regulator [Natrinema longum]MBZ6494810.1 MarR family transcriptional regulator [Natrinema longum]QSW86987.1 MarR family transcriptional regulator [Natrinema longum]